MAEQENKVYAIALNYYEQLLPVIPVNDVLVRLLPKRVINLDDKQLIKSEKTDRRQAELLLDSYILKRTQSGEEDVFYTLLEVMYESGKCDSLVKKIYKDLGKSPPATSKLAKPIVCVCVRACVCVCACMCAVCVQCSNVGIRYELLGYWICVIFKIFICS